MLEATIHYLALLGLAKATQIQWRCVDGTGGVDGGVMGCDGVGWVIAMGGCVIGIGGMVVGGNMKARRSVKSADKCFVP